MSNQARLNQIQNLLSRLQNIRLFRIPSLSDQVFELYCYFRKLEEFVNGGKILACQSRYPGIFRPHLKPGRPRSGDYFRLIDPKGGENRETMPLIGLKSLLLSLLTVVLLLQKQNMN